MPEYAYVSTIGQDSHRFGEPGNGCSIMLGGISIPSDRPILANSDGDVILHAITNAVSGFTGKIVLGGIADKLCLEEGIKDSSVYLKKALEDLKDAEIIHCSLTVECLVPKLKPHLDDIRAKIGELLGIPQSSVGMTATTGEGLTAFGRGEGIQVFVILSFRKKI
ncbi:MAG: 2-C-methyl-D-erythritol 2,4-cyclodiphosphate synthase [Ruminococcaceae bacterium]|nr:2-C-methyl-D-erythritol 2,4-cyclodiphosphate synthase [Oscillospiraceae bacterium]